MYKKWIALISVLLFATILSLGTVSATTRSVTLRIKGMTCDDCATAVEKALKSSEGVEEVTVSYQRGRAVIKYNDQKITIARLREIINNTGFTCEMK